MSEHIHHPIMPEHYRAERIAGMLPDQIIYPSAYAFSVDETTREMYIDVDQQISAIDAAPTGFFGQAALMKVLHTKGKVITEGFIADLRHAPRGNFHERNLSLSEDPATKQKYAPLLGAIFVDMDGREYYSGDERFESYAMHLAVALDNLQEELDFSVKRSLEDRLKPAADVAAETPTETAAHL